MDEPLFSCQVKECATEVSYPASDLRMWKDRPICEDCFEQEPNYDEATDTLTYFHELPRFVPEYESQLQQQAEELEGLREQVDALKRVAGLDPDFDGAMPYVLQKGGYYYAHNSCGYVGRVEMAELYTKDYAESHARSCEEVRAFPISVFLRVETIEPYIERLLLMRQALKAAANGAGEQS